MARRGDFSFLIVFIASGVLCATDPTSGTTTLAENQLTSCEREGLQPNYSSECREYFNCKDGEVKSRHTCPTGLAFSTVTNECVPASNAPCIQHLCDSRDNDTYTSPSTKCGHYYRCIKGEAREDSCVSGSWFDWDRNSCRKGVGLCREPVCAGRRDGPHPDTTNGCRRALLCQESKLRGVVSCPPGELFGDNGCRPVDQVNCENPTKDTIAYTVGDDEGSQDCRNRANGIHTDPASACNQFYYCSEGKKIFKKSCEYSKVFNGKICVSKRAFSCPIDDKNPCVGKGDGFHRDLKDCRSFYYCERGQTTYRDECAGDLVWDGNACVQREEFTCLGPVTNSSNCKGKPKGIYQDRSQHSLCKFFYHCENGKELKFECPFNTLFDGERCVSKRIYTCPSLYPDSCDFKSDGYYKQTSGGCRGYYLCVRNSKIVFVCDDGFSFNGKKCVPAQDYKCPHISNDCRNKSDGYHKDVNSNCRDYYYCENGEKVTTFQCPGIKVYNGESCVYAEDYECPIGPNGNLCALKGNGFFLHYGTDCRSYYRCTNYIITSYHTCDIGKRFNGIDSCVNKEQTFDNCVKDGFFADFKTKCRSYYSCIEGKKTAIDCPGNKVFNGDLCVPGHTYTCPEECF